MARRLVDSPWTMNAQVPAAGDAVAKWCALEPEAERLLRSVARVRALSPRAQHRLRNVARTIEDLSEGSAKRVTSRSMASALALRLLPDPDG